MGYQYNLPFYCYMCGLEFPNQIEVYTHKCSQKELKKDLNKASTETGASFGSSE